MIVRETYVEAIKPFIDKPQIKIITGIRRSGKSTVLRLLEEELLAKGIKQEQIVFVNFESLAYSELLPADSLYQYIKCEIKTAERHYFLLDEIQEVEEFEGY